jgi:hypothetical protein
MDAKCNHDGFLGRGFVKSLESEIYYLGRKETDMTKAIIFIFIGLIGTFVSAKYFPPLPNEDDRFWRNYLVYLLGFYPLFHGTRLLLLPQFGQELWHHSLILCAALIAVFIPAYRLLSKKMN